MVWLPIVKKFEHMFIYFDRIHERNRQTDRQTDGHCISLAQHRAAIKTVAAVLFVG